LECFVFMLILGAYIFALLYLNAKAQPGGNRIPERLRPLKYAVNSVGVMFLALSLMVNRIRSSRSSRLITNRASTSQAEKRLRGSRAGEFQPACFRCWASRPCWAAAFLRKKNKPTVSGLWL